MTISKRRVTLVLASILLVATAAGVWTYLERERSLAFDREATSILRGIDRQATRIEVTGSRAFDGDADDARTRGELTQATEEIAALIDRAERLRPPSERSQDRTNVIRAATDLELVARRFESAIAAWHRFDDAYAPIAAVSVLGVDHCTIASIDATAYGFSLADEAMCDEVRSRARDAASSVRRFRHAATRFDESVTRLSGVTNTRVRRSPEMNMPSLPTFA